MKYLFSLLFVGASLGGFIVGRLTAPPTIQYGATGVEKQAVITKLVEANARLKQGTEVDSSLTTEEIAQSLNDLKRTYNISGQELGAANGDILTALETKLGARSKLCNDPNSTSQGPIKQLAAPR